MTAKCTAQRRNGRRLSARARPLVGLALVVFVVFALLGAPAPVAAAQPAPRPEPTELWRQFPLDANPSHPVGRSEARPRSSATTPATESKEAEARSLPFSMVQIGPIVAATTLVLLLLAGVLAYSANGLSGFAIRRRERRLARPFRDFVDAGRADPGAERQVGTVTAALRPAMRKAEATLRAVGRATVDAYVRIGSEVGQLKRQSSARIMPWIEQPTTIKNVGTLGDRSEEHIAGGESKTRNNAAPEVPKTVSARHRAPPKSLADNELEILKAKLGKPAATADKERVNEAETLKAKLRDDSARKKEATTAPSLLKRKLAKRHASEKAIARAAVDVASPSREPKPSNKPGNEVAASGGLGTRSAGSAVRQEDRAARPTPSSARAAASRRAEAAAPLGLVQSQSGTSDRRVVEEPLEPEKASTTKCRILWWRGYLKSQFYALARTPEGQEYVIAESPHFRWSKAQPPPSDLPAIEAHRSLLEALESDGWSVAGTGEHWFMLELERQPTRHRRGSQGGQSA